MAKNPQQDHLSSKRHFHWTRKVGNEEEEEEAQASPTSTTIEEQRRKPTTIATTPKSPQLPKKKLSAIAVSRLKSVLTAFHNNRLHHRPLSGLGTRVVGTLFGHRRGHVHFAFQKDPSSRPAFLIELATPISGLVKEMASGLVRIALECDKESGGVGGGGGDGKEEKRPPVGRRLLEEGIWRTYCNGKKCGFANRRECGEKEWKVLKAVEPISMGAGVLPAGNGEGGDAKDVGGEIMYMRAKFERIVGSRDSEAFYMMNPDSNGAPELSVYLLRV